MGKMNFDSGDLDLPFGFDDETHFDSPIHCLEYAYSCTESAASLGDGIMWIDEGLRQFPQNPDLLAFVVIYNIKNYNVYKNRKLVDDRYVDKFAEMLLSMDRTTFSIRAYVACLIYCLHSSPERNISLCREFVEEMRRKFSFDICVYLAELLLEEKIGDGLLDTRIEELRKMYSGLYMCQTMGDTFSDYITSIIPLFEMILDELKWPHNN